MSALPRAISVSQELLAEKKASIPLNPKTRAFKKSF